METEAQDSVHPIILGSDGIEVIIDKLSLLCLGDFTKTERDGRLIRGAVCFCILIIRRHTHSDSRLDLFLETITMGRRVIQFYLTRGAAHRARKRVPGGYPGKV